jgi:hypothetical protein
MVAHERGSRYRSQVKKALSDAVKRFLTDAIISVERLEVLLVMHRHSTRWWTAEKLAANIEMPIKAVQSHLEHLSACNLLDVRIAESVIFCYKPAAMELSELVEEIARVHYLDRDAVVAALAERPADSTRLFADAFDFRKVKKPDG